MLSFLLILSSLINVALGVLLFRSTKIIFSIEDQVNDSLDELDKSYARINKILQIPVAFDDPQIKMVVKEISSAKDSILLIANKITKNMSQVEENK